MPEDKSKALTKKTFALKRFKTAVLIVLLTPLFVWGSWKILREVAEQEFARQIDNMAGEESYQISEGLIIHKTSATTYTLCDADNTGLINGKLVEIYISGKDRLIAVSYVSFLYDINDFNSVNVNDLSYAYSRIETSGKLVGGKMKKFDKDECVLDRKLCINMLIPVEKWIGYWKRTGPGTGSKP